jgi:hypothetical protein
MSEPRDADINNLAIASLQRAIRRVAARILEAPGALSVSQYRRVERLMRIAIALAGAGRGMPTVEVHGLPPTGEPAANAGALPELFTVTVTDLLAARAADQLPAALQGDAVALRALDQEAERLLETENVQLG